MKTLDLGGLRLQLDALPPPDRLAPLWTELAARSPASFFTDWPWIGTWLACVAAQRGSADLRLLRADRGTQCVGLAIVTLKRHWRFGVLPVLAAHLHETGRTDEDAITIEYNGMLAASDGPDGTHEATVQALTDGLFALLPGLDELRIGAARGPLLPQPSYPQRSQPHPTFQVDLAAVRANPKGLQGCLDYRHRYTVRRALRRIQEADPLVLDTAPNSAEAQRWMQDFIPLHSAYWAERGSSGAFGSAFQRRFHELMMAGGIEAGHVQLLRFRRGDKAVAYLYFYVHRGWAHCYQSAFDYAAFQPGESPGLAAHAMAIDHFAAQGFEVYDLMAGEFQYKRTLATRVDALHWQVLQRRTVKMALEARAWQAVRQGRDALRAALARLQAWRQARQQPAQPAGAPEATPAGAEPANAATNAAAATPAADAAKPAKPPKAPKPPKVPKAKPPQPVQVGAAEAGTADQGGGQDGVLDGSSDSSPDVGKDGDRERVQDLAPTAKVPKPPKPPKPAHREHHVADH